MITTMSDSPSSVAKKNKSQKPPFNPPPDAPLSPFSTYEQPTLVNRPSHSTPTRVNASPFTLSSYLLEEILGCANSDTHSTPLYQNKVADFLKAPLELESLLFYGFCICLDSFVFVLACLPIRLIILSVQFVCKRGCPPKRFSLSDKQLYDLLRAFIILVCTAGLCTLDYSHLYHFIRSQNAFKLYVIYNLLEVLERLCCSFGRDFDELYPLCCKLKRTSNPNFFLRQFKRLSFFPNYLVIVCYTFVHSLLLYIKVISLNVTVNAYNHSLLTLMVSNNFVELKGNVFKNFKIENIFQITCADIVERFQNIVFLGIVCLNNLQDISWELTPDLLSSMLQTVFLVTISEVIVDSIKHAFILKFNQTTSLIYKQFGKKIANELLDIERVYPDSSTRAVKVIGFLPYPLTCVVFRIFIGTLTSSVYSTVTIVSITWAVSMLFKLLFSLIVTKLGASKLKQSLEKEPK
ncbi:protein TAPT1 homolog [Schistocerca gregaria]|uniref:protein TAPT1 homolog n=1 Tax=Schistocerca gregaria TaxID=7010 RepID=UPI00211DF1A2|nr:protein TAPT1 homolog [Schistocerca gregaria]